MRWTVEAIGRASMKFLSTRLRNVRLHEHGDVNAVASMKFLSTRLRNAAIVKHCNDRLLTKFCER